MEQLYLTKVLPYLKDFVVCDIYGYELKKFNQELAESINQKNIYTALDLPDFKDIKDVKLEASIIQHSCKKLKIGSQVTLLKGKSVKTLNIDGTDYQLILFPTGTIPEVNLKNEKIIFFMYQNKYQKIYYCGKLDLKILNESTINDFYTKYCFNNTKKFISFNNLNK